MYNQVVAQELLKYRGETVLKKQIEKCLREIRRNEVFDDELLEKSGLAKIIKKISGITVNIVVETEDPYDFAVATPALTELNVLSSRYEMDQLEIHEWWEKRIDYIKKLELGIDLHNFKISGPLSDLPVPLFIGLAAFKLDSELTVEECTSLILHELGHVFYFMLFIINGFKTNVVLNSLNNRGFFESKKKVKITLLKEIEADLDINLGDEEAIANLDTEPAISVLIKNAGRSVRKEIPTGVYEFRTFEFMADQFAVVNGAGRALATGLRKLVLYDPNYHSSKREAMIANNSKILVALKKSLVGVATTILIFGNPILMGIFSGGVMLALTTSSTYTGAREKYDPPILRLNKIKEQLIAALRDRKLSAQESKKVLEDINAIDEALSEFYESINVKKYLSEIFIPWVKKNKQIVNLQLDYEKLVNNPLYKQSVALRYSGQTGK